MKKISEVIQRVPLVQTNECQRDFGGERIDSDHGEKELLQDYMGHIVVTNNRRTRENKNELRRFSLPRYTLTQSFHTDAIAFPPPPSKEIVQKIELRAKFLFHHKTILDIKDEEKETKFYVK